MITKRRRCFVSVQQPKSSNLFNELPNARHESGVNAWMQTHSCDASPNSGDFIDFISLDDQTCAIVVGDVAGSGVHPSVAARSLGTFVRSTLLLGNRGSRALQMSDRFFSRYLRETEIAFASLFIAMLDARHGVMTYASAGHETALLYPSPRQHTHLSPTGPLIGLGLEEGACGEFTDDAVSIRGENVLVIATDGITDARSTIDPTAFFGSLGIVRAIASARASFGDPARAIYSAALLKGEGNLRDDASVVVVQLDSHYNSASRFRCIPSTGTSSEPKPVRLNLTRA
jgi:hypothetical protein